VSAIGRVASWLLKDVDYVVPQRCQLLLPGAQQNAETRSIPSGRPWF
jgi:hypothetical protein